MPILIIVNNQAEKDAVRLSLRVMDFPWEFKIFTTEEFADQQAKLLYSKVVMYPKEEAGNE